MAEAFDNILDADRHQPTSVRAVGLDTPGPATAQGVISTRGSTNFGHVAWRGFDIRGALEHEIGLPVVYNNDANAAALYAHHRHFGPVAASRSSVAAIVGTGLGGGVVEAGRVISGAAGMAGELGHVPIPVQDLLEAGQPMPECNCGQRGDAESVASLTGIEKNLLPYWLSRYPDHELAQVELSKAAKMVRSLGERRRRAGPQGVRAAGDRHRQPVHDRGELHRPRRLLPRRRRGRDGPPLPRLVPRHRARAHRCARSSGSSQASPWCPTGHGRRRGAAIAALDTVRVSPADPDTVFDT